MKKNLYIPFRLHPYEDRDIIAFMNTLQDGARSHAIRAALRSYMRGLRRGKTEHLGKPLPMSAKLDIDQLLESIKTDE